MGGESTETFTIVQAGEGFAGPLFYATRLIRDCHGSHREHEATFSVGRGRPACHPAIAAEHARLAG